MAEWTELTLGEVCGPPQYGAVASGSTAPVGPRFVRQTDLVTGRIDWTTVPFCDLDPAKVPNYLVQVGDILISRLGNGVGNAARVSEQREAVFAGYLVRFRVDESLADSRFVSYQLQGHAWREHVRGFQSGAAQPTMNAKQMAAFRFRVPPRSTQKAIADVLGALDDKIAANKSRVNATLDLVNAEFTRRFGGRELTLATGNIADVVDCLHSKKPERVPSGRSVMQLVNIRDDGLVDRMYSYCVSDLDYQKWSRKFETRPWDLVITNVGRIGAVARIPEGYEVALGRNMTGIRPKVVDESGSFLASALLSASVRREIDRWTDAGSVMNALNVKNIPRLRLQASSVAERRAFHEFGAALYASADRLLEENIALATTRDTLLPALMSGRLRVEEAEEMTA